MRYFANHPKLAKRLERLKSHHPNYIVHEYFNQDSNPFYFMDLAQELAEAKLSWVGPANALDTLDEVSLTKEQRDFLGGVDDVALRQTTRDHMIDQQFRRDIFIKGPVRLPAHKARERWLDMRFALTMKGAKVPREVRGIRHTVKLQNAIYDPLIASLEQGPKTLREVMSEPALAAIGFSRLVQAVTFLVALGACHPCLPAQGGAERKLQTDRFNRAVAEESRAERKYSYFASPVTGGGLGADRMSAVHVARLARRRNGRCPLCRKGPVRAGQRLLKDGKPMDGDAQLKELRQRVAEFEGDQLAIWSLLGLGAPRRRKPPSSGVCGPEPEPPGALSSAAAELHTCHSGCRTRVASGRAIGQRDGGSRIQIFTPVAIRASRSWMRRRNRPSNTRNPRPSMPSPCGS